MNEMPRCGYIGILMMISGSINNGTENVEGPLFRDLLSTIVILEKHIANGNVENALVHKQPNRNLLTTKVLFDRLAMNILSFSLETKGFLASVKFRLVFPAFEILRTYMSTVQVGTKWLPEIHHVQSALTIRAGSSFAVEVNAKKTKSRHNFLRPSIEFTDLYTKL